jgi:hypothetical protein
MARTHPAFISVLAVASIAACATVKSNKALLMDKAIKRAAFDSGCAASSLDGEWLDPSTVGVSGCGTRLTYVYPKCSYKSVGPYITPGTIDRLCSPVLNSDGKRTEPAPATAAATAPATTPAPTPASGPASTAAPQTPPAAPASTTTPP